MPRALGQIDEAKTEAILDAAQVVFSEKGFAVSMDEIARVAGVSKQTVYNRFGAKEDLILALVERRLDRITAPFAAPDALDRPEETIAAYARAVLGFVLGAAHCNLMRVAVQVSGERPEIGRMIYEAGPLAGRRRLAEYLRTETNLGRLNVPDPELASELLAGMVGAHLQLKTLLGVEAGLSDEALDARAKEIARRFVRAYG